MGAYAYFTAAGSGTGGAATVGDTTSWTVDTFSTTGTALYPGSGSQTVTYKVTNGSAGDQHLNNIAASISTDTAAGANHGDAKDSAGNDIVGCLASWFSVPADGGAGHAAYVSLASAASETGTAVVTMPNNTVDNQDKCRTFSPAVVIAAS